MKRAGLLALAVGGLAVLGPGVAGAAPIGSPHATYCWASCGLHQSHHASSRSPKSKPTAALQSPSGTMPEVVSPSSAPPPSTATKTTYSGRSTRDTLIIAFLLTDVLVLLLWRHRPGVARDQAQPITSIYDEPNDES